MAMLRIHQHGTVHFSQVAAMRSENPIIMPSTRSILSFPNVDYETDPQFRV